MAILLKLIQSGDASGEKLAERVPEDGLADIPAGSACIVQESQVAVFFRDGKMLDVLGPGRHVLSTATLPVLSELLALPYGSKNPFQAAVYYVNQKVFTGMKWGTRHPVAFRDRELGVVELRACGVYAMRVAEPCLFLDTLTGTRAALLTGDLEEYLRDVIVSRLNDLLGERLTSILDLPALYNELATETRLELREDFTRFGIDLIDFFITSVVPTEEVQKALDERAGIPAVGPLAHYLQYQAAKALGRPDPAGEPTPASPGLGIGVGAGLGLVLPQAFLGKPGGFGLGACPQCGSAAAPGLCTSCRKPLPAGAVFCPSCGIDLRNAQAS